MKSRNILLLTILLTAIILGLTYVAVHAQTAEELLQAPGLTAEQRAAIAEAIAKKAETDSIVPKTLEGILEWQEMGTAFATTIESVCKTLRVEVNEFLKSEVGMLTAGVIIYKMVGKDIMQIFLYTGIWIGVTFFMIMSIKFIHMKKRIKEKVKDPEDASENAKEVIVTSYVCRFDWPGDEDADYWRMASLFVHIVAWFIFSVIIAYNVI